MMISKIISEIKLQPFKYIFPCLLISLLTFVVYGQTLGFDLIAYDDDIYIGNNPHLQEGFTYPNFVWSVAYFVNYNWAPLTIWSYIVDASIYGGWYGGYHLTNIMLHGLNGLLLFFIAYKLSNKYFLSLLLAILFIVHPQHVESVSWLSQRKDLLSTLFMFLSLLSYIFYKTKKFRHYYLLSIGAFMLGLMAKVIIAPLPVVLILIDYIFFSPKEENRNFKYFRKAIIEKLPYFVIALIFGGINYYAQYSTGALGYSAALPADIRVSSIPLAYWFYPIKTLAPYNLIPFYPYPKEVPLLISILAFISLIFITVLLYLYRDKYKYLFFGWFFYLITATPMSGIFQTGGHVYADRYSYIASVGLLIIVIAMISGSSKFITSKALLTFVGVGILTLTYMSYVQASLWKDTYTLFSHTLRVSPDNMIALRIVADELISQNKLSEAEKYIEQAIKSNPHDARVYSFAARYYAGHNQSEHAKQIFNSALKADIWQKGIIYRELAQFYMFHGDYEKAIKYSTTAIETQERIAASYLVRGSAYKMNSNYSEAIVDIQKAISINRQYTPAYIEMGNTLIKIGLEQKALEFYMEALKQDPSNKPLEKRVSQLVEKYDRESQSLVPSDPPHQ